MKLYFSLSGSLAHGFRLLTIPVLKSGADRLMEIPEPGRIRTSPSICLLDTAGFILDCRFWPARDLELWGSGVDAYCQS